MAIDPTPFQTRGLIKSEFPDISKFESELNHWFASSSPVP